MSVWGVGNEVAGASKSQVQRGLAGHGNEVWLLSPVPRALIVPDSHPYHSTRTSNQEIAKWEDVLSVRP